MGSLFLYLISKESFETIAIEFDVGCVSYVKFITLKYVLSVPSLLSLYRGWMLNLSNTFSASVDHVVFTFCSISVIYHIYCCFWSLVEKIQPFTIQYDVICEFAEMPFTWLKMVLTKSSSLHIFIMKSLCFLSNYFAESVWSPCGFVFYFVTTV